MAKLETHLRDSAATGKTELLVKCNACPIRRVNTSNEKMVILALRRFNQLLKNKTPDAAPTKRAST